MPIPTIGADLALSSRSLLHAKSSAQRALTTTTQPEKRRTATLNKRPGSGVWVRLLRGTEVPRDKLMRRVT